MRKVSIRLPDDVRRAYEVADGGSMSALMRRRLTDAVADGELEGVGPDLQTLAERERVVDSGRLARKRATFKSRAYRFYRQKWEDGAVTGRDARELSTSWRSEAKIYDDQDDDEPGPEAFLDALLDWYEANYTARAAQRPEWPDAGKLLRAAGFEDTDPVTAGIDGELVEAAEDMADRGVERADAFRKLSDRAGVDEAGDALTACDGYDRDAGGDGA